MSSLPPHPSELEDDDASSLAELTSSNTSDEEENQQTEHAEPEDEPEQEPPRSPRFLILTFLMLILALYIAVPRGKKKPEIIYAKRYSDKYLHRPAASPVITETLKDGRIRLRGTHPPPVPMKTAAPKKTTKPKKKAKKAKRKPTTTKKAKPTGV